MSDNGPGIPESRLHRITEPFFTTRETGTGLGLAICQTLAVRNGARLSIHSRPGQGTEVRVQFPPTALENPHA